MCGDVGGAHRRGFSADRQGLHAGDSAELRQIVVEQHPRRAIVPIDVGCRRLVDVSLDRGAHDVGLSWPTFAFEEEHTAALPAEAPASRRGGSVSPQSVVAFQDSELGVRHSHPRHERRSVGATAEGAVAVCTEPSRQLELESHRVAEAAPVHAPIDHGLRASTSSAHWSAKNAGIVTCFPRVTCARDFSSKKSTRAPLSPRRRCRATRPSG